MVDYEDAQQLPTCKNPIYKFILTNPFDSCVKLTDLRLLIEKKLLTIPCPGDRNRVTVQKWFPYTPAFTFAPFLCVGWWTRTMFYTLGTRFQLVPGQNRLLKQSNFLSWSLPKSVRPWRHGRSSSAERQQKVEPPTHSQLRCTQGTWGDKTATN